MSDVLTAWPELAFHEPADGKPWRRVALGLPVRRMLNTAPLWGFVGLLAFGWLLLPCVAEISGSDIGGGSRLHLFLYLIVREGFLCGSAVWWIARQANRRRDADIQVEALGQAVPSGIALIDGRRTVRYANGAFLRLFHTDRASVMAERLDRALGLDLSEAQLAAVLPPRGKSRAVLSTIRQGRQVEIDVEITYFRARQGVEWWVLLAHGNAGASRQGAPAIWSDRRAAALTLAA